VSVWVGGGGWLSQRTSLWLGGWLGVGGCRRRQLWPNSWKVSMPATTFSPKPSLPLPPPCPPFPAAPPACSPPVYAGPGSDRGYNAIHFTAAANVWVQQASGPRGACRLPKPAPLPAPYPPPPPHPPTPPVLPACWVCLLRNGAGLVRSPMLLPLFCHWALQVTVLGCEDLFTITQHVWERKVTQLINCCCWCFCFANGLCR
jgi:hypothetical protein